MAQYRISVEETASWQKPVESVLSTPPVAPAKGDRYIVGDTATGAWAGKETNIAWYDGSTWKFDVPVEGWQAYNKALDDNMLFNGTAWVEREMPDITGKMDKQAEATENNLVSFDADGNSKDSGVSAPIYDTDLGNILMTIL